MTGRFFTILFISVGLVVVFSGLPFVEKSADKDYVAHVGVIEATEVHLSSKVAERIASIPYEEGDLVPLGAPVIRLQMAELAAEIARAEANVLRGAADIGTAKAMLEKERASLKDARRHLDRISKLHADALISTAARDEAQTAFELARAEVNVAKARILSLEAERNQRRAHLQLFKVRLKERTIYASIAGRVSLKAYEAGEMVSPGTTIVTLIDLSSLWARVDVEEGAIGKIRIGSPVALYMGSDRTTAFSGEVVEIGTAGAFATQRDTTRGRQDIKTFRVKIRILSQEGLLKPGMTVSARLFYEGPKKKNPTEKEKG